jgi:hypothetical protein
MTVEYFTRKLRRLWDASFMVGSLPTGDESRSYACECEEIIQDLIHQYVEVIYELNELKQQK